MYHKTRKDWYVELKRCFYFTHILIMIIMIIKHGVFISIFKQVFSCRQVTMTAKMGDSSVVFQNVPMKK